MSCWLCTCVYVCEGGALWFLSVCLLLLPFVCQTTAFPLCGKSKSSVLGHVGSVEVVFQWFLELFPCSFLRQPTLHRPSVTPLGCDRRKWSVFPAWWWQSCAYSGFLAALPRPFQACLIPAAPAMCPRGRGRGGGSVRVPQRQPTAVTRAQGNTCCLLTNFKLIVFSS